MNLFLSITLQWVIIICSQIIYAEKITYKGYKIYELVAQNEDQSQMLYNISQLNPNLDFLNLVKYPNVSVHVVVSPEDQTRFENTLSENSMFFKIIENDLSKRILAQQRPNPRIYFGMGKISFNRYYRYMEINDYLDNLDEKYPRLVKVKTIGYSYEGKPIKSITISNGIPGNKKVILIDAGIHAREWIAPATALYIINKLVEKNNENKSLLEKYEWVIIPLINPDGYEYSMFTDRMWRKTRKPNFVTSPESNTRWTGRVFNKCNRKHYFLGESYCDGKTRDIDGFGVDGNRNFNIHWENESIDRSGCSKDYRGPIPFSELETQAIRNVMHSVSGRAKMYLTLHSYGAMIVYPWAYQKTRPASWKEIEKVANVGAAATEKEFKVGSAYSMLYQASGSSMDYALGEAGIPISLTMELPPKSFDPNPREIQKLTEESWFVIKAMAEEVQKIYP